MRINTIRLLIARLVIVSIAVRFKRHSVAFFVPMMVMMMVVVVLVGATRRVDEDAKY
jgi:hypothetical protein